MPRLSRLFTTGKIFFITTNLQRGLHPFNLEGRRILCEALTANRLNRGFRLPGYVIMPNHAHLLIAPRPEDSISAIVQQWKRRTSIRINRLRSRKGQVWQKGYFDRYMRTGKEFIETLEYIHLNPVRKGLAKTPEDWAWSSAGAYAGNTGPVEVDFLELPAQTEKRI